MDVLSDVIAVMRTGEPRSARVAWHAPWGQRFRAVPGAAGFQVVLRGSCWLLPENGAPIALSVGDVVFFPRGAAHALVDHPATPLTAEDCGPSDGGARYAAPADGPGTPTAVTLCGAYQLDPRRAHPLLASLPEVVHLPAQVGRQSEIRAAVELLGGELTDPRPGVDAVVPALLDTLLLYVLRAWFTDATAHAPQAGWAAALADPRITAALDALHRAPGRAWTITELGALAQMSRAAFARRFTALVGRPPLAYLTWWRMATAARMLREGDDPLGRVAERVGYGSEFAFAAAFKREYGTAPGRYRREQRGEVPAARSPAAQSSNASGGGQEHTRLRSP
ncbi:AraC family transcriptional regulator [Actinomadura hibisca]|uniref:AraC family transcriptional regulator n=1 Tax=Actinomadura hibisca TaxID=68565 RepID=UPI0008345B34|nr:AraC family transcriptional regulator [Actinomadura hibisca]